MSDEQITEVVRNLDKETEERLKTEKEIRRVKRWKKKNVIGYAIYNKKLQHLVSETFKTKEAADVELKARLKVYSCANIKEDLEIIDVLSDSELERKSKRRKKK